MRAEPAHRSGAVAGRYWTLLKPVHVLSLATLYPRPSRPAFGVFVETRLALYAQAFPETTLRVISPQAWFERAPAVEVRRGLNVLRPRCWPLPGTAEWWGDAYFATVYARAVRRYIAQFGRPDVIDAHFLYPDGAAAARVAEQLGIACVLTARGSDVTYWMQRPRVRARVLRAAETAACVVSVSQALRRDAIAAGMAADKIITLRNGVDTQVFRPAEDRAALRQRLGFNGFAVLSVGHLIARKGHDIVIDALPADAQLHIVGTGGDERRLRAQAAASGKRVTFHGSVAPQYMPDFFAAADVLMLASSHEGMANVLLESMACGTPVIASDVGGARETVSAEAGMVVNARTAEAFAAAMASLRRCPLERAGVRRCAEALSWSATLQGMHAVFCAARDRS